MNVIIKVIEEIAAKIATDHPHAPAFNVYFEAQTLAHELALASVEIIGFKLDDLNDVLKFRPFPATSMSPTEVEAKRANEYEQIEFMKDSAVIIHRANFIREIVPKMHELGVSDETVIEYVEAWCGCLRVLMP